MQGKQERHTDIKSVEYIQHIFALQLVEQRAAMKAVNSFGWNRDQLCKYELKSILNNKIGLHS